MSQKKIFTIELDDQTAMAVAQFLKRRGWSEVRALAFSDDEAEAMRSGLDIIQRELNQNGFDPR